MTSPATVTETTLVTESLTRFYNGGTPSATEIARAIAYGLQTVKRDIMAIGRTWRPLIKTYYEVTAAGKAQYDNPSDWEKDFSVSLMSGSHSGVLQTVTSTTSVTLAAAEDILKLDADGSWLMLTSGTGIRQAQQIGNYTFATKIALMNVAYATLPVTGDGYLVCNTIAALRYKPRALYGTYDHPGAPGTPAMFTQLNDGTYGQLALYPVPNAVYGLKRLYYADLRTMDTATTLYTSILTRWARVIEQGVYVWKLGEDDDRYASETQVYQALLAATANNDFDGQPQQMPPKKMD